ncbi:hypothetical protein WICPIJ_004292 [Wickerhamomyces pijperi]|uniref:TNase-like domain-containing protein n=1 Tax=Wickerhamomyces pijperi TaxID=599730 RepID=A0A9P8Q670_WICPI|nr:hypothetical protein WICPIJ_004292 [Wickerhamomyces pijperi]
MSKPELIKGRFRKDLKYRAIITKVIAGDRIVSEIHFDDQTTTELVTLIAGIRTPRSSDAKTGTAGEPFGDEAKKYIEVRLNNQRVHIQFIGTSSTDVPIVKVFHPAGNISEKIILDGLAEPSDWQSSLIGPQGMQLLRNAERTAKQQGKGQWKSLVKPVVSSPAGSSTFKVGSSIDATIHRVVSPDTLEVELSNGNVELVYLTSTRAPRAVEPAGVFLPQGREFVRKYVGKKVKLVTDAFRNEKPLVSITLPNGKNLAESIILNGYATAIRHRRGDDDRANNWDSLLEAEEASIKEKKGIHSTKIPEPEKLIEASQDANRSKIHLRTLQNKIKVKGVLEYVISPNRFRVVLPKESIRLVLVLGGLSSLPKDSPLSGEIIKFNNKNILQRDVTIEVYDADKVGGFIGNLYVGTSTRPYQIELLSKGYAQVHDGSVHKTKFEDAFFDAEEDAQDKKLGLWVNYDPEEAERQFEAAEEKRRLKYEEKNAKFRKPNAFDDDEDEDLENIPEHLRNFIVR